LLGSIDGFRSEQGTLRASIGQSLASIDGDRSAQGSLRGSIVALRASIVKLLGSIPHDRAEVFPDRSS
jgi:hypothetical protein